MEKKELEQIQKKWETEIMEISKSIERNEQMRERQLKSRHMSYLHLIQEGE